MGKVFNTSNWYIVADIRGREREKEKIENKCRKEREEKEEEECGGGWNAAAGRGVKDSSSRSSAVFPKPKMFSRASARRGGSDIKVASSLGTLPAWEPPG